MEASSVTGPAKNLIGFGRWLKTGEGVATGMSLTVATFDRSAGNAAGNGFVRALNAAGIDVRVMRERRRLDLSVVPQLRAVVAEVKPGIIQTHNNKSHLMMKWAKDLRIHHPWLAFHHGDTYTDLKQRIYNEVDRLSLRSADLVVTVCQAFLPQLAGRGVRAEHVRVLHNSGVPQVVLSADERDRLRSELGIGPTDSVALTIGRLSKEKGHSDLLKAIGVLGPVAGSWKFVLAGDGPEREALWQLARNLHIEKKFVFAGFRADVVPLYSIADLLVLPSHIEGSSNVLLEAMMAGLPIVATRAGGNAEILVDGQSGILVDPKSPGYLARAIEKLIADRQTAAQLAAAAYERAVNEFSVSRYRSRLLGIYGETLSSRRLNQ